MDENAADLVVQLCTRIGILMEDASVEAVTIARMDPDGRLATVRSLDATISEMRALLDAAKALSR